MAKARTKEKPWTTSGDQMPERLSKGSMTRANVGSPIQPNPRLAKVTPSCTAESEVSRLLMTLRATRARGLPRRARSSICALRTLTMANSVATKKALTSTRQSVSKSGNSTPSIRAPYLGKNHDTRGSDKNRQTEGRQETGPA